MQIAACRCYHTARFTCSVMSGSEQVPLHMPHEPERDLVRQLGSYRRCSVMLVLDGSCNTFKDSRYERITSLFKSDFQSAYSSSRLPCGAGRHAVSPSCGIAKAGTVSNEISNENQMRLLVSASGHFYGPSLLISFGRASTSQPVSLSYEKLRYHKSFHITVSRGEARRLRLCSTSRCTFASHASMAQNAAQI